MTVNEIIESTGQKRGVIEQFRSELFKYGLISNNESINIRAFEAFKKAIHYKDNDKEQRTWSYAITKALLEEYGEEMKLPFEWSPDIIVRNLIWEIEEGIVNIYGNNDVIHNHDFHIIFEMMIDNFVDLANTYDVYMDSRGSDGNPVITYKCCGNDYIYYIVGKHNHITKNEDIHVFYNDGKQFNIMKCKHICGGDSNKGKIKELINACWDIVRK